GNEKAPKKKFKREQTSGDVEQETLKNCDVLPAGKKAQSELKSILEKSSQKLSEFLPILNQSGAREGILYLR
ncbi:UNVERIFIED_CONTAM: hypothetical protein H355_010054, partial [Colinus virginianus]